MGFYPKTVTILASEKYSTLHTIICKKIVIYIYMEKKPHKEQQQQQQT
eukprot:gene1487-876_t